jgi:hypothetical protein
VGSTSWPETQHDRDSLTEGFISQPLLQRSLKMWKSLIYNIFIFSSRYFSEWWSSEVIVQSVSCCSTKELMLLCGMLRARPQCLRVSLWELHHTALCYTISHDDWTCMVGRPVRNVLNC